MIPPRRYEISASGPQIVTRLASAGEKISVEPGGCMNLRMIVRRRSENRVSGTVLDDQGRPIPAAAIMLASQDDNTGHGSVTDEDGRFKFDQIPPGHYWLKVSSSFIALPETYNPGVPDRNRATTIQVTDWTIMDGLELRVMGLGARTEVVVAAVDDRGNNLDRFRASPSVFKADGSLILGPSLDFVAFRGETSRPITMFDRLAYQFPEQTFFDEINGSIVCLTSSPQTIPPGPKPSRVVLRFSTASKEACHR